ncbi:MAG: DNA translocase FtsK 4TM domain-containing protein [Lachnospiraceae bacterium]|nr:DNA translocase FtsK 4TM domain-containing protein [Lachnospiraceae bacterium]
MNNEIILMVVLVFSILLLLSNFNLVGAFGRFISKVMYGLFGLPAFLFPFVLFLGTAFILSNKGSKRASRKTFGAAALWISITALIQLFGRSFDAEMGFLDYYKASAENKTGGGLLGGIVCKLFCPLFGTVGTYVILFALIILCLMFLTGKALFAYITSLSEEGLQRRKEERQRRQEEEKAERAMYEETGMDSEDTSDFLSNSIYDKKSRRNRPSLPMKESERRPARTVLLKRPEELPGQEGSPTEDDRNSASNPSSVTASRQESLNFDAAASDAQASRGSKGKRRNSSGNMKELYPADEISITGDYIPSKELAQDVNEIYEAELREKFGNKKDNIDHDIFAAPSHKSESSAFRPNSTFVDEQFDIRSTSSKMPDSLEDAAYSADPDASNESASAAAYDDPMMRSVMEEYDSSEPESGIFVKPADCSKDTSPSCQAEDSGTDGAERVSSEISDSEILDETEAESDSEYKTSPFDASETVIPIDRTKPLSAGSSNSAAGDSAQNSPIRSGGTGSAHGSGHAHGSNSNHNAGYAQNSSSMASRSSSSGVSFSDPIPTEAIKPVKEPTEPPKEYVFPSIELLSMPKPNTKGATEIELKDTAAKLQKTLESFGVRVTITNVSCGPAVTRYELQPEQGVKVSRITALSDDIKLNLAAADVRIEAPIPGKAAVGIEVPNKENPAVMLRELFDSPNFKNHSSDIAFAVGKDIGGQIVVTDIAKMPHLLIAGATGSGKSVCINTLIMSILYKAKPSDVRLIMVDPKVVELSVYNGIPHLLIPVVTDPKKASAALNWAVMEMTDRYQKFAELGVRDLKGYNEKVASIEPKQDDKYPKLPQIVIIVDELADLMMVAPGEVEDAICRLAQMARAAGLHLIIATQRPSVNVITGLIKANIPSRIAFSVSSAIDSRTILDGSGAEKLLGKGDMLFFPSGFPKPIRVQGAFVSDKEVSAVVDFLKNENQDSGYSADINDKIANAAGGDSASGGNANERDDYFIEAGKFIIEKDKASIGMLQRVYKIGFNRAARIMDQLAEAGVVGPEEGTKPRKVLMSLEEFEQYVDEYV